MESVLSSAFGVLSQLGILTTLQNVLGATVVVSLAFFVLRIIRGGGSH